MYFLKVISDRTEQNPSMFSSSRAGLGGPFHSLIVSAQEYKEDHIKLAVW
jgi:hypothetical protein